MKMWPIILIFIWGAAQASGLNLSLGAINIQNTRIYKGKLIDIQGRCFETEVAINNIDLIDLNFFYVSSDDFKITLRNRLTRKSLIIDSNQLSDFIKIDCKQIGKDQLLIFSQLCSGSNSSCGEFNHMILNNFKLEIIAPRERLGWCDDNCLQNYLKENFLKEF